MKFIWRLCVWRRDVPGDRTFQRWLQNLSDTCYVLRGCRWDGVYLGDWTSAYCLTRNSPYKIFMATMPFVQVLVNRWVNIFLFWKLFEKTMYIRYRTCSDWHRSCLDGSSQKTPEIEALFCQLTIGTWLKYFQQSWLSKIIWTRF